MGVEDLPAQIRRGRENSSADKSETLSYGTIGGAPKSLILGRTYFYQKDERKARAAFDAARLTLEHSVEEKPRDPDQHMFLAEAYARLGRKDDAIREAKSAAKMIPESKDPYAGIVMQCHLAETYVMVGEFDVALPIIQHCVTTPAGFFVNDLRLDKFWDAIRSDPRFQQIVAQDVEPIKVE